MKKDLLIIGAGQYGLVAKETAELMNVFGSIDFLDDINENAIGKVSDYKLFVGKYNYAFVAVGNPEFRLKKAQDLEEAGYILATLIHPDGFVSPSAEIHNGSIIEVHAVVSSASIVSRCCIVSAGAIINHNSTLKEGCHVDCGAVVCSNSVVPEKYKVNCGQVFNTYVNPLKFNSNLVFNNLKIGG